MPTDQGERGPSLGGPHGGGGSEARRRRHFPRAGDAGSAGEYRRAEQRRPALMFGYEFYLDPSRCIGCQSCLKACEECETHRGISMINFDFVDRQEPLATAAYVCGHCDTPTGAQVCPADAIKKYEDGIVGSSLKPRC